MILLEYHNRVIEDALKRALSAEKPEAIDEICADFDDVLYHLSNTANPDAKSKLILSVRWPCYKDLKACGLDAVMEREYKSMITTPETGYNFSLLIDLENLPESQENIIRKCSMLRRNLFAAPFEKCFDLQASKGKLDAPIAINYRPDSALYLVAQPDRVTAVFSVTFQDADDIIIGKVFLQEFVDARKKVQEAPQVIFSKDPPAELASLKVKTAANMSYVTFVLFPRHFKSATFKGPAHEDPQRENCTNMIQTFRDYLHYHIKCSKAYLHCRMRDRVAESLKILNRARPEVKTEKKSASGRTFVRK
jgi:actin related protein 2/3 complex subunit 2